jgi:chaperonin GroEL (HSP60 family)
MLKMLMDPMGGIVMTNDGNAILREVRKHMYALNKKNKCLTGSVHLIKNTKTW